jgi:hypothetical protein
VSKPTVAHYIRYFRPLYTAVCPKGTGPYGDARRRPVIHVYDNFPKKRIPMGENGKRNILKTHTLSSVSFPKTLLLGRVGYASCFRSIALLP